MGAPTIGIDVGGTKIAAGVVDGHGNVVARVRIPTEATDLAAIIGGITKVGREMRAAAPAAQAVGVGAAALISHGVILGAPNLAWRDLDLRQVVEDRLGLPAVVDNDANVATLAEATYGAARGAGHVVMLTIGTGIGGGLVLDGRLYRGANGVGAELGHMVIDPGGPRCPCGNNGCLEVMASGTAIGRIARERSDGPGAAKVLELAGNDPSLIVGETVVRAALAGDAFAISVLDEVGEWLGMGMANYVNIFDPEVFVLGGGAALGARELLLAPAVAAMEPLIVERERRPPVRVAFVELGDDAGVIGAAVLARELI
jgi:glucokinase